MGQQASLMVQQLDTVDIDTGITHFLALMDTQLAAEYRDRLRTFLHRLSGAKKTANQHAAFLRLVSYAKRIHADVTAHGGHSSRVKWDTAMEYIRMLGTGHRTGFGKFSISGFHRKLSELHKDVITHPSVGAATNIQPPTSTQAPSTSPSTKDNDTPCSTPSNESPEAELPPYVPSSVAFHTQEVGGEGVVAGGEGLGRGAEVQQPPAGSQHGYGIPPPQPADAVAGDVQPSPAAATATSAPSAPQSATQLGASVALPSSAPPSRAAEQPVTPLSASLPAAAGQAPPP